MDKVWIDFTAETRIDPATGNAQIAIDPTDALEIIEEILEATGIEATIDYDDEDEPDYHEPPHHADLIDDLHHYDTLYGRPTAYGRG